jgi:hypothetical protein
MTTTRTAESAALTGVAGALTGVGILTMALFPLAIPILVLTAVFVAPLVILPVAAALPVAIVAGVVLAIRAIGRRLGRWHGSGDRLTPVRGPARRSDGAHEIRAQSGGAPSRVSR